MSTTALVPIGSKAVPIYLRGTATRMSLGLPGLAKIIERETGEPPSERALYVFVSKDFRRVKLFYWDRTGYAMWYKCVPRDGAFRVGWKNGYRQITGVNVRELCKGMSKKMLEAL